MDLGIDNFVLLKKMIRNVRELSGFAFFINRYKVLRLSDFPFIMYPILSYVYTILLYNIILCIIQSLMLRVQYIIEINFEH